MTQERFQSYDTPDTYEIRIRPLLLGVADNDTQVLGFLKSQLTGDLYMMMRIANPGGIDAFFTELKTMWLDRAPNLNGGQNSQGNSSAEIDKLNSKIASLETQLAESIQVHSRLAQRLHLPENVIHSNNALSFDKHINEELEKRLGVIETNLAELSAQYQYSESSDHSNEGLEKRVERIKTHLAKLNRKDTRVTKSSQRPRSKFSTPNNNGLEKRLGRIETLLAKLAKDFKSKSGRVHIATVDERPNSDFSDNDASKPEDEDFNSDSSSADSNSGKRDMNVYMTYEKKVKCAE